MLAFKIFIVMFMGLCPAGMSIYHRAGSGSQKSMTDLLALELQIDERHHAGARI